jgi:transposase
MKYDRDMNACRNILIKSLNKKYGDFRYVPLEKVIVKVDKY